MFSTEAVGSVALGQFENCSHRTRPSALFAYYSQLIVMVFISSPLAERLRKSPDG
jgi:hypothetical protein